MKLGLTNAKIRNENHRHTYRQIYKLNEYGLLCHFAQTASLILLTSLLDRCLKWANFDKMTVEKQYTCFILVAYVVPKFREREVENFFVSFEKMADRLKWPSEYWTTLLHHVLVGKGLEVYNQIGREESADYEYVKEAILRAYEQVPEAYRQKFRSYTKASSQTYAEFAHAKQRLFDQWCHAMKVGENFGKLRQVILLEDFKNSVNANLKVYIDERKPDSLNEAATLADEYSLIHQSRFNSKSNSNSSKVCEKVSDSDQLSVHKQSSVFQSKSKPQSAVSSSVICNYCKKRGHVLSECRRLKWKKEQTSSESQQTGSCGHVSSCRSTPFHTVSDDAVSESKVTTNPSSGSVMESFQPFIHDGFASLSSDFDNSTPIKVLRDTGASQSLMLVDALPFSDSSYSGTNVLIKGIDSTDFVSVPLHNIHLSSSLVSGPVTVGVRSSLPFDGIQLLLGNDLAGDKVVVNPIVTVKPCVDQPADPVEEEIPDLYPACAVTRSMSKKSRETSQDVDVDLMETFVGKVLSEDKESTPLPSVSLTDHALDKSLTNDGHQIVHSDFVKKQRADDTDIAFLFQKALTPEEAVLEPVCFYIKNDVLMRKWRPPNESADEDWAVHHQVVVPESYRQEIISMAHDTPLSGHLGVNKTYHKISQHFYWPNMKNDVAKFCRSCHTCQMVGKPNQTIPKAHLQPIPAFEEPFSRILVDCVGPLPRTRSGNEYMLTIMCTSTRFPEAIPLRNIKAKTVVKALKFFTLVGLPNSLQSKPGSNFVSGVLQQVKHELGTDQKKSSALHHDRRKETTMLHVGMLKRYVWRDKPCENIHPVRRI